MSLKSEAIVARNDNLALIRLLAAVAVVYGHAFPLTGFGSPGYLMNSVQTIAVKIFFIISGMLITESWLRDPNLGRYIQRRLLRIVPALLFLCILTILIIGPLVTSVPLLEYFGNPNTYRYLWNVLFYPIYNLPGLFTENIYKTAVNGSLWTLPIEMGMYIVVPLIMLTAGFSRTLIVGFAVGSVIVSLFALRGSEPWAPYVVYGTNLWSAVDIVPYFFIGMAVTNFGLKKFANVEVAFLILVIAPLFAFNGAMAEITLLVALPFLVISFAYGATPYFLFLERFGDISYGVYLYGFLFQQIVVQYFDFGRTPFGNFLLALGLTVVFATASWKWIEKPALALKPKRKASVRKSILAADRA